MAGAISKVDAHTLSEWLQQDKAVIIDVREPNEFTGARIPGALSMPLSQLAQAKLPEAGDRHVVICCASGARSLIAADRLLAGHYGQVYNLDGGLSAWRMSGRKVDGQGAGNPLSALMSNLGLTR